MPPSSPPQEDYSSIRVGCRDKQLALLSAALEPRNLPPCLFLWGPPSTGKGMVLNFVLAGAEIRHTATISGVEIMCGKRAFLGTLLDQLISEDEENRPALATRGSGKCENLRVFVQTLRTFYTNKSLAEGRSVLIVEEVEQLRSSFPEGIEVLSRLQEMVQGNVCVVFVSSVVGPLALSGIERIGPLIDIRFPQYEKEELIEIVAGSYYPGEDWSEDFTSYVKLIVSVFYQGCRDLRRLLKLVQTHWEDVKDQNLGKVWKDLMPKLREKFREMNEQVLPMDGEQEVEDAGFAEIPKYSRYILIAAYLATHNPASSDKKFFVKAGGKRGTKKGKLAQATAVDKKEEREAERIVGLKAFDQNRLKSIFGFLVNYCGTGAGSLGCERWEGGVDWLTQISSLCNSMFLQRLGEDSNGNVKYRCLADHDFIAGVARSVNFELDKFLYKML